MKQAIFLYNPQSGSGRIEARREEILQIFREAGYAIEPLAIDFHANPFEGHKAIDLMVVAGGDGTINFALNRMKEKGLDIPLGVIPAGTANDFAGALGMDKDPVKAARQIATGEVIRVDCGRVNDIYFVNIFSFGLFTTTSQRTPDERKHRWGKLAYIAEGLKELRRMHKIPLQIRADGQTLALDTLIALIFNGETAGGFPLARRSSIQDGHFECLLLEKRNFFLACWTMIRYLLGGSPKSIHQLHAREIEISSPLQELTDVDGQRGAEFPLSIRCLRDELRIQCHPLTSTNQSIK
ncbi:MAG: YegS/Rv2252/BmrU family lipid kinase [Rikenellaceae bacterium]|nr:YegS/Rv2252/BmrU family lipid kinase [Rikenellaceae bacterium]